jgi:sterol desaturase/sphingolipid hydroxylase (fatty acid hydroxylase superfamily)
VQVVTALEHVAVKVDIVVQEQANTLKKVYKLTRQQVTLIFALLGQVAVLKVAVELVVFQVMYYVAPAQLVPVQLAEQAAALFAIVWAD